MREIIPKVSPSEHLVQAIVEGIKDRKGHKIVTINLSKLENAICKFFVVCEGDSNRHVDAIADNVEDYVRDHLAEKPLAKDGVENAEWIVIDYGDVMVHVFQRSFREFYNLEGLWADGILLPIEEEA